MRRNVTYPDPNRPGWWSRVLAENTAPPARLEIDDEPEAEPDATPEPTIDLGPLDPSAWAWTATVDQNQALPTPEPAPRPPNPEPIDLGLDGPEPWPDEEASRRPGWRCDGGWIRLADGLPWALPVIDFEHLLRYPALRNALADVVTLEQGPKIDESSDLATVREAARLMNESHDRVQLLAVCLLALNYELGPEIAARLVMVPDPMDWCETIAVAADGLGRDAVALCVARGVPVCKD